jgi:hypothetical protein
MSQNINVTLNIFWGDQSKLYEWDTISVTEATGFTGQTDATVLNPATQWSFAPYGSWMIATNGVDVPQVHKGTSFAALNVESQFTTAEIFIFRGPHLLAFNTSVNDKGFLWSDTDNPEVWLPTASNAAGDLVIREAQSEIMAAVPLGQNIAVYTKEDSYIVSYVGSPNYFGYRPGATGIGALSKHSVVSVGRQNFGWGRQGIWVSDGVGAKYIDAPVREYLSDNVNFTQGSKICSFHDEENKAVKWFYQSTSGSDVDAGVGYNYETGEWFLLGYGRTACAERNVFDYALGADSGGEIYYENFGDDADGSALISWVRTRPLDGGVVDFIKEIEALRVGYTGSGLKYRIGTQEDQTDEVLWTAYFDVKDGFSEALERVSGRYLTLEFYSNAVGANWDLSRVDVHGRVSGTR